MKNLSRLTVYRRLNLSYIAIISATILLISSALFLTFRASFIKDANAYNTGILEKKAETFSDLVAQANYVAVHIMNKQDIVNYLNNTDDHPIEKYRISMILNEIYPIYPFISFIELCNTETGRYYNTLSAVPNDIAFIKETTSSFIGGKANGDMQYLARSYTHSLPDRSNTEEAVFSVFIPNYSRPSHYTIINIPQSYVASAAGLESSSKSRTLLVSADGAVASSSDASLIGARPEGFPISDIQNGCGQGFTQPVGGQAYIMNYAKCSFFDLYMVKQLSSEQAFSHSRDLFSITCLIAVLTVLAALLLVLLTSRRIYAPIVRLIESIRGSGEGQKSLDEFQIISEEFLQLKNRAESPDCLNERNRKLLDSQILVSLLTGKNRDQLGELLSFSEGLRYMLEKKRTFTVVLFVLDSLETDSQKFSEVDIDLIHYGLRNILSEVLGQDVDAELVSVSLCEICAVLSAEGAWYEKGCRARLSDILALIDATIALSASAVLSVPVRSALQLSGVWAACRNLSRERFFRGSGCVIDSALAAERAFPPEGGSYPYAEKILDLLYDPPLYGQMLENTGAFIRQLGQCSYERAQSQLLEFVVDLKKSMNSRRESLGLAPADIDAMCDAVKDAPYLSSAADQLVEIMETVKNSMVSTANTSIAKKHYDLVKLVKASVKGKFRDPALSLNVMADEAGVSAGYLGKIFKEITEESFAHYLLNLRLDEAKKLLITTQLPAFRIAEETGIVSATYFTTLYKKKYGRTPAQFREYYNQTIGASINE